MFLYGSLYGLKEHKKGFMEIIIENGDDPIFKYLNGNKFALIDISMIRMCNKIKIKAS